MTQRSALVPLPTTKDGVKFGKELRDKEFLFEKGFLNLNHGEFLMIL